MLLPQVKSPEGSSSHGRLSPVLHSLFRKLQHSPNRRTLECAQGP